MDYFSDKSNSFYDRQCNNEIVKMQRQSMEQLKLMTGIEYQLLHVKEPILYVVRKQHRHSPEDTTPLADYYIIAGRVYQAPDLASVFNSRILSTVHNLQQAFDDASSYAKFHPTKGYTWDFSNKTCKLLHCCAFKLPIDWRLSFLVIDEKKEVKKEKPKEESASQFQRQRVDMLLGELLRKFPIPQNFPQDAPNNNNNNSKPDEDKTNNKADGKTDATVPTIKQEPMETNSDEIVNIKQEPSEKKMKL